MHNWSKTGTTVVVATSLLIAFMILANANQAVAQQDSIWKTNSSNVYYQNGNVGIGTPAPQTLLQLDTTAGAGKTQNDIRISRSNYGLQVSGGLIQNQGAFGLFAARGSDGTTGANIELYQQSGGNNAYYDADKHIFRSANGATPLLTIDSNKVTSPRDVCTTVGGSEKCLNAVSGGGAGSIGAITDISASLPFSPIVVTRNGSKVALELKSAGVGTGHLQNNSVTADKIANNTITANKLARGTLSPSNFSWNVGNSDFFGPHSTLTQKSIGGGLNYFCFLSGMEVKGPSPKCDIGGNFRVSGSYYTLYERDAICHTTCVGN